MPRSRLPLLLVLALAPIACSGSTPDDGSPFRPSDAHHESSIGDDETTVDDDTGVIDESDTGGGGDDSSVAIDEGVDTGFTCPDDHYDVNGDPSDGCEVTDDQYHSAATALDFGAVGECDSNYKWVNFSHFFASDARIHEPSGVNGAKGLPQFIKATLSSDTFCQDDPSWQMTTTGGSIDSRYRVTVYPNADLSTADTACSPNEISGDDAVGPFACNGMSDGEPVMIKIEKVSGPPETISYTFQYHN